jgi:hypothetical protein
MIQNFTGQQLSYKRSANLQIAKQQELRYNAGDRHNINYSAVQRQQMWSNTASDSIPQHNRGQYGNRNIVQTPTQQHFFSPAKSQSKPYVIENTGAGKPGSSQLHLISFNCKNIKTCGPINPRSSWFFPLNCDVPYCNVILAFLETEVTSRVPNCFAGN